LAFVFLTAITLDAVVFFRDRGATPPLVDPCGVGGTWGPAAGRDMATKPNAQRPMFSSFPTVSIDWVLCGLNENMEEMQAHHLFRSKSLFLFCFSQHIGATTTL